MESLDDAVALLVANGVRAQRLQWQLGDTVVATPAHGVVSPGGIEVFAQALYIVCTNGSWEVVSFMRSGPAESAACGSLTDACNLVTKRLASVQ